MLNKKEQRRYLRQLILSDFGEQAQNMLKESKVLVIGAGGLGGPASIYLAAAGVGHLVICDGDTVELSNLNRQILHGTNDIERSKAASAQETLSALNPEIRVDARPVFVDDITIDAMAEHCDIIVDCLDNIKSRHVLNRYSLKTGTPVMHAGIDGWNAQLCLLHPPETPCLQCLFQAAVDTPETKPVLGAVAGIVGTTQALETIKYLTGTGSDLKNKLLFFNALTQDWSKIDIAKDESCDACARN